MRNAQFSVWEKTPKTPRKVVIYTDNLMSANNIRIKKSADGRESVEDLFSSLDSTLNTALVVATSLRFDPELNILEILDPHNPRNNIEFRGITDYTVTVKLFMLPGSADMNDRPSPTYVRQAITCVKKQLGVKCIHEFFASFIDVSHPPRPAAPHPGSVSVDEIKNQVDESADRLSGPAFGDAPANMERYARVWRFLNKLKRERVIGRLGVCDFGVAELDGLEAISGVLPDMVQVRRGGEVERELAEYAKRHGMSVHMHEDSAEILTNKRFQDLSWDYKISERFPTTEVTVEGARDFMKPRWVASYALGIRGRGIIVNRGYIVMASSDSVLNPNSTYHPSYM